MVSSSVALSATAAACETRDDDVEEDDNAVDDGVQDCTDRIHDGHQAIADCLEDGFDLWRGRRTSAGALRGNEVKKQMWLGSETYAGDDCTHFDGGVGGFGLGGFVVSAS